jgi:hypothetical protein
VRLYAFWRYSCFPFVLGGEVLEVRDDGLVKVKNYGGATFRPIKILPYDAGRQLWERLRDLTDRHARELQKLKDRFLHEAQSLVPEII